MLRPTIIINKINPEYPHIVNAIEADSPYSSRIYVNSFTVEEDNEGVSIEFDTIHDRYSIALGDKLVISMGYYGVKETWSLLPIMVVTDVSISSDFVMKVVAIDEFSYYSQILDFIPFSPDQDQIKFLGTKMGINIGDLSVDQLVKDNISINEIFDYIYSIIKPYMFDNNLQMPVDESIKTNKIQPPTPQLNSKISDFIKVLRDNYYIDMYMSSIYYPYMDDGGWFINHRIIIETIGNKPLYYLLNGDTQLSYNADDNIEAYKFVDNINIISDDLVYLNPLYRRTCAVGKFTNKDDKETKTKGETEVYYAFYNNKGEIIVTTDRSTLPTAQERIYIKKTDPDTGNVIYVVEQGDVRQFATPIQLYNTVTVNNADSITTDKRKEYTVNMLKLKDYLGYSGSFTSFQFGLNITNLIDLYLDNNKLRSSNRDNSRVSGRYRIKGIRREYGSDGLYISIDVANEIERF